MLGPDAIAQFIDRGYLYLPGAVPQASVHRWVESAHERIRRSPAKNVWEYNDPQINEHIAGYDPERSETWPSGRITVVGGQPQSVREVAPAVWEAIVALAGSEGRLQSHYWSDDVIVDHRAGQPPAVDAAPHRWNFHVDDPEPDARLVNYPIGLVALVLLSDIGPGEGATVLAPDSLSAVARLLANHPRGFDLTDNHRVDAELRRVGAERDRVEVVGRAGDVYLTHGLMAHAVGPSVARRSQRGPWRRMVANPGTRVQPGLNLVGSVSALDEAVARHFTREERARLQPRRPQRPHDSDKTRRDSRPPNGGTSPTTKSGRGGRRSGRTEVVELPLPTPQWLLEAFVQAGIGAPTRVGAIPHPSKAGAALRVSLPPSAQRPDVVLLYGPAADGGGSGRRMPFESATIRVAYVGGDGGEPALELCQTVGSSMQAQGARLLDTLKEASRQLSLAVDTQGTDDDRSDEPGGDGAQPHAQNGGDHTIRGRGDRDTTSSGPFRRMSPPSWLTLVARELGFGVKLFGRRGALRMTLNNRGPSSPTEDGRASGGLTFQIVDPTTVAFKLAWTGDGFGIVYSGHDPEQRALCGRLGRALSERRHAVLALMERAGDLAHAFWPPVVSLAVAAVRTPNDAGDYELPELSRSAVQGLAPSVVDELALVACTAGRPGMLLQLAELTEEADRRSAPLTHVLAAWLRGKTAEALRRLDGVVEEYADDVMVLRAVVDLAFVMGDPGRARRWARRRADHSPGNTRGLALLSFAEMAARDGETQDSLTALEEAAQLLNGSAPQLQALARSARLTGAHELAKLTLRKVAQRVREAEAQVALAEVTLWDMDLARASAHAKHGEGHPNPVLAARAALVFGACAVLKGDLEEGRRYLEASSEHHPEPETVWAWRCDAASLAGDWQAAEAANYEGQTTLHTLANALTGCLMRARQAVAEGGGDVPWTMAQHDPDGVLFGRLDHWIGEGACGEARQSVAAAARLLESVREAIGGNRTKWMTRRVDGTLEAVTDPGSPRMRSAKILYRLTNTDPETAKAALQEVVDEFQDAPQPPCFLGELALWRGDYDAAEAAFEVAHARGGTRWAWIGQGAVRHMLGRYDEADERYETCVARCGFLEGATLVGYRGEMKRLTGDLAGAKEDLHTAVRTRPGRVGAWINLALLALEEGDAATALKATSQAYRRVPHLLLAGLKACGGAVGQDESITVMPRAVATKPVLQWALEAMLGNRSSTVWTHGDPSAPGGLRTLPDPHALVAWARAHSDLAETLAN